MKQEDWKEMYETFEPAIRNASEYGTKQMLEVMRVKAGISAPPGHWWGKADGVQRNTIHKLINLFVDVKEVGNPVDGGDKTQCRLCQGWNGLHHDCQAANIPYDVYSYEEALEKLTNLVSSRQNVIY